MTASVDFCGEIFDVPLDRPLTLVRSGDVELDDNPYLHRRFLELWVEGDLLWLANVGNAISATVADDAGLTQTWLSPGARIPIVFPRTAVWFTAGPTTYDFEILNPEARYVPVVEQQGLSGGTTLGRVSFTPDQKLLLLALSEDKLRKGRGAGAIPHSSTAAERLNWSLRKFNRKIDNVCEKLTRLGVSGLHGSAERTASNRRARLVEYALASRLITSEDLALLDAAIDSNPAS